MRYLRSCVLALLSFVWLVPVATAADRVPGDRRLPPQVLGYVSVRNVPELKADWKKTALGQLSQEKELAEFWQEVEKQLDNVSGIIQSKIGVGLNDILALPQGEVAVAVVQLPGKKLSVAVFLDAGENEQTVTKLLAKGTEAAEEHGVKRSTEEFEGIELVIHTRPKVEDDDTKKDGTPEQIAYFRKDGNLIASSDVDTLKSIITRWDGKHEQTFAETDIYRQLVAACRDEQNDNPPAVTWFIDPIGLVKGVLTSDPRANTPQMTLMLTMLPTLGIDKFKAVGGTVDLATGDYDTITRTLVYLDSPPTGVINLFQFPAVDHTPPKWIPAQSDAYFGLNWDLGKAVNTVESLVDMFQGAGAFRKLLDQVADREEFGKLHPKKDLLDHLSGRLHIVSDLADPKNLESQRILVAAELKNAAAMKKTLAVISKLEGFPGKVRKFQGETVIELSGFGGGDAETMMGFCVSRDYLMFASNVTLLEQVLRTDGDQDSLANLPAYQRLAKKFPAESSMISFERENTQLKAMYELLRSGEATRQFGESEAFSLDFSKLPEFDVIRKYLSPSASYMRPDKLGLLWIGFTLKSEAKDDN
ncbi:MAG: hypothetical protein HZA46_19885 [Planctomycetales bacterium]|nr:hypothetical protein [Planctomycetales bacterium]